MIWYPGSLQALEGRPLHPEEKLHERMEIHCFVELGGQTVDYFWIASADFIRPLLPGEATIALMHRGEESEVPQPARLRCLECMKLLPKFGRA